MKRVLIIGGDERLRVAKKQLDKENFLVETLGLYPDDNGSIESSDVILLPVPTTKDGQTVFSPLTNRKIFLDEIGKNGYDYLYFVRQLFILLTQFVFMMKKTSGGYIYGYL